MIMPICLDLFRKQKVDLLFIHAIYNYIAAGVMGISNLRFLVHGASRTRATVPHMVAKRTTSRVLDDWLL